MMDEKDVPEGHYRHENGVVYPIGKVPMPSIHSDEFADLWQRVVDAPEMQERLNRLFDERIHQYQSAFGCVDD